MKTGEPMFYGNLYCFLIYIFLHVDIGQGMEFEENDEQLGLCSTPGRSEMELPYNSLIESSVCSSKFSCAWMNN